MTESKETIGDFPSSTDFDFDVIIVGAGVAGINAAYYLHTYVPGTSYAILDGRSRIGGTWDLFRYPGVRSDSDMIAYSFSWSPWTRPERLASGEHIHAYLQKSAEAFGIDKNIRFDTKVISADWSTVFKFWTLAVTNSQGEAQTYRAKFILLATGFYDSLQSRESTIPGLSNFEGPVINPQFWPKELDYSGKDVVVIGSGATAITIIPSMAEKVNSITMLQRSPTYILPEPNEPDEGRLVRLIQWILPSGLKWRFNRMRSVVSTITFYNYCMKYPAKVRLSIQNAISKQLPANISWNPHFNPKYDPWTQRLCITPEGDFYAALRSGKANVITDTIETVTSTEIQLTSGQTIRPDIIVTATGLKLQFAGGIKLSIEGKELDSSQKYTWKGSMIQDVPNLMFVLGYVNTSWTMGGEIVAQHLVRLLRIMKRRRAQAAVPRLTSTAPMPHKDVFKISSTYVQGADQLFPMAGTGVWDYKRNYLRDIFTAQFGNMTKGLCIE